MKVSKETKQIIHELVASSEEITQVEIVRILQEREEKPSIDELFAREYGQTANRLVSQVVDGNGIRIPFAIRSKKGTPTYYVNLDRSTSKPKVKLIIKQLRKQRDGIDKSLHKARRRLQVLQGQLSLDEYMK